HGLRVLSFYYSNPAARRTASLLGPAAGSTARRLSPAVGSTARRLSHAARSATRRLNDAARSTAPPPLCSPQHSAASVMQPAAQRRLRPAVPQSAVRLAASVLKPAVQRVLLAQGPHPLAGAVQHPLVLGRRQNVVNDVGDGPHLLRTHAPGGGRGRAQPQAAGHHGRLLVER